jgi:dihydrofolate reductase
MTTSLDGYINGPDGSIDWSAPDESIHRFHNERVRRAGVQLCGRRLYEIMRVWDALEEFGRPLGAVEREFADIWQPLPKIVFSSTLTEPLVGNATLAKASLAETIAEAQQAHPGRDIAIGGATLAAAAVRLGLVDDFHIFIAPVLLGGGTPYLPDHGRKLALELVETRTFSSRVVYLHYRRA